jgi:hypothetical protein
LTGHRPIYTSDGDGLFSPMRPLLQQSLEPLINQHRVDVVVVGHEHCYERSCGIASHGHCAPTDEQGTVRMRTNHRLDRSIVFASMFFVCL